MHGRPSVWGWPSNAFRATADPEEGGVLTIALLRLHQTNAPIHLCGPCLFEGHTQAKRYPLSDERTCGSCTGAPHDGSFPEISLRIATAFFGA